MDKDVKCEKEKNQGKCQGFWLNYWKGGDSLPGRRKQSGDLRG
jgi:hypothetical protein